MGWLKGLGPPEAGGSPRRFLCPVHEKEAIVSHRLSIFVDESGDFGNLQPHSPYYIVTMLFHDQNDSIAFDNEVLDANIRAMSFFGTLSINAYFLR